MAKEKIRPPSISDFPGITPGGFRFLQQIAEILRSTYGFHSRVEEGSYNWDLSDLTADAQPHDLDMSAINGAKGAYAAVLSVAVRDADATGSEFIIRPKSFSGSYNVFKIKTQVANVACHGTAIVPLDSSLCMEYIADAVTWDAINIGVVGWFI